MKPEQKREVTVTFFNSPTRMICFDASPDAAQEFGEYGGIFNYYKNHYRVLVDARYDFDEVLAYIQNYGND